MAAKTDIELALANLEAGKFSFRMVDTIKAHISTLETDLASAKSESESVTKTLLERDFTIARLEAELRKVNAKVHALVKANALTEAAMRETARGAALLRDYAPIARKQAVELSKKTLTYLSSLDLEGEFTKVKSHPVTQKALSETQAAVFKAKENLPIVQKRIAATVEKVAAYIATLHKTAA